MVQFGTAAVPARVERSGNRGSSRSPSLHASLGAQGRGASLAEVPSSGLRRRPELHHAYRSLTLAGGIPYHAAAPASDRVEVSQATEGAKRSVIEAELRSLAVQHNFSYPEDVVAKLAADSGLTVDDKFKVKGAEKLVKDLATARPEWLKRATFNGAPPRGNGSTVEQTEAERQAAIQNAINYRRQSIGAVI